MSTTHILTPTFLGVEEAIPLVRNSLGNISFVGFVKEPTETEESTLTCHRSRRLSNTNAAFDIINLYTTTFLTDSHLHFPNGVLLAKCRRHDIEEQLKVIEVIHHS